jgi:hypothetical protein
MFKKMNILAISPNRFWMKVAIACFAIFLAACSSATATPANIVNEVSTQVSSNASTASNSTDACTLLPKEDVSKALGMPVDSATSSGLGGVCTYIASNLKIEFTTTGQTGGQAAMATTLSSLGNLALLVPGLGDQAFYNTNSANALFLLKGDAEYLFGISDVNYQPLDPADVQAKEKALAEQLLNLLP